MELIVTKELANRAKQFGACKKIAVGTDVTRLAQSDLRWAEERSLLQLDESIALPAPLWALAETGYGYGYGDGDGDGDGAEIEF